MALKLTNRCHIPTRAEPVSAIYEQGRAHHVGCFRELERELTTWAPGGKSPNRLDALVWALTHLLLDRQVPLADDGDGDAYSEHPAVVEAEKQLQEAQVALMQGLGISEEEMEQLWSQMMSSSTS